MKKFSITDNEEFASLMRSYAASSLAEEYLGEPREYEHEELECLMTLNQVQNIVEENSADTTEDNLNIISENEFDTIFNLVRVQLYHATMSQLAAKGYLECAWNDKKQQMEFWVDSRTEE